MEICLKLISRSGKWWQEERNQEDEAELLWPRGKLGQKNLSSSPLFSSSLFTLRAPVINRPKGASLLYVNSFCVEVFGSGATLEICRQPNRLIPENYLLWIRFTGTMFQGRTEVKMRAWADQLVHQKPHRVKGCAYPSAGNEYFYRTKVSLVLVL